MFLNKELRDENIICPECDYRLCFVQLMRQYRMPEILNLKEEYVIADELMDEVQISKGYLECPNCSNRYDLKLNLLLNQPGISEE